MTREVNYKHTFNAISSETLEVGTRVLMGLRDDVTLLVDVCDEENPPVEAGTTKVGLWKELVSVRRKVYLYISHLNGYHLRHLGGWASLSRL